jgi:hypothetical protein
MLLATTTVPWALLWLFYFESWLVTGAWDGGGIHPETPKENNATHSEHRRRRY